MSNRNKMFYKVCVRCMTYNQSAYITDAMNGFAMQQTNFPFVAVIVDDASNDGEQDVVKSYIDEHFCLSEEMGFNQWETEDAHWIFARHKENDNCHFVAVFLKRNLYKESEKKKAIINEWLDAKYVALCEGDDYWIDPLKLQKQVDFLEEHPDYSLCCHRYKIYNQNDGTWADDYVKKLFDEQPDGFSFSNKENLNTWITKTLSLVYRSDCYDPNELKKYKYTCDEHSCYHLLKKGMGYCFPFFGGVYRRTDSSVFSPLSDKQKFVRWCLIRSEMLNNNLDDKDLRNKVFNETRRRLYEHDVCNELLGVMKACIKAYYRTDGFKGALKCRWKLLKSFVSGFF